MIDRYEKARGEFIRESVGKAAGLYVGMNFGDVGFVTGVMTTLSRGNEHEFIHRNVRIGAVTLLPR